MDSYFWSRNAKPDALHFLVALYFALCFPVARFLLDKFIFRRLSVWLLSSGSAPSRMNIEARQAIIAKCSESMWKLTYFATAETWVLKITYNEPWFRDVKGYFRDWPNQELKISLSLIYMCQCGFYIYSIVALLTWETRRKDFAVMMSHHVITAILIGYSYVTSFFRIGSVVLALHDASDVFLEAAKIFKYSGRERCASVCFGLFAASWLLLRLTLFPFWVIKSSSYDVMEFLRPSDSYPKFLYYFLNTMLLMLLVFHVYWWVLICSMITRQWQNRGKVSEDIRSDSEDDGD
ncbi:LONGEVITY ASSURANCE GENE1 HOMOLOG 2, LAG1 homologue 2 [Hibiscus trionum]|uniref:LONGEVITY ASSURANCE GENE1 HOMOLOG 2, LAG1 homologue 2 n=1 Tax=Hibiscus trionum TaxID=183268 RepID=A0A9W7MHX6_HIBTR|nr:LONGEVITY ASSURANCE GENE1 HOMOLOG 2, LAG1 homologue 2 [Hibiscus trionum]